MLFSLFISNLGGGGGWVMFFLHFMLFPTFLETNNSGNTFFFRKVRLHLLVKWEVVSPNSRYRELLFFIECFLRVLLC